MKPESSQGRGVSGDFIVRKKRVVEPPKPVAAEKAPSEATETPSSQSTKKAKKRWKQFRLWFLDIWQPLVITVGVAAIICTLLGFQIGSLTNGLSAPEHDYIASVNSGKELLSHPSFLIHKLPVYVLFKLNVQRVAYYRLVSATFGAVAVLGCFYVLRRWYSLRVALLGAWLALTSAWLLHTARLATPEASFLLLAPLLWAAVWMYTTKRRQYALTMLFGISIASFYIPGFVWLVVGVMIWQHKAILYALKQVPWWFRICIALAALIGLAPLVYGATQHPNELLLVAGLPTAMPNLSGLLHNAANIPIHLFLRGPEDPVRWLGQLPILDVFSAAMLLLGIYSLRYHLLLVRAQLLVFSAAVLALLIILGGPVNITALMPIVYLLIAGGIAFMLQQWFVVFPRNPIARTIATTLISVLVLLVSYYHISHYFIAWPQTPATKQAFGLQMPTKQ